MPSVNLSANPAAKRLPAAGGALPASMQRPLSLLPEARPCVCGSRLPLGVRLHLRSRARPVFEGRWCCSPACLQARISTALRREVRTERTRRPHQHRVPLGLMLLSAGRVTRTALQHALQVQAKTGERIGEILTRECGVSEDIVAEALAIQWNCSVWDVSGLLPSRVSALAPRAVLRCGGILPLRLSSRPGTAARPLAGEGRLSVAFASEIDSQAVFALRHMHDIAVDAGIAPVTQWSEAHRRLLDATGVRCQEMECSGTGEMERAVVSTVRELQPVESRWVRLHDLYWLRLWLQPAAMLGGPSQEEGIADFVFHVRPDGAAAA